jgi:phenylpropionate dioxygenase-like ring-hydroxylating dioxygenase large terminal subunit
MELTDIRLYVDDRPDDGVFRVDPAVFADPELFELEQKHIFARCWNFLALESQLARPNAFVSTWIGRTPILVTRTPAGAVAAFLNACRHKGAVVCRAEQGTAKYHVCPYHGWGYDSAGRNVDVKDRKHGEYAAGFERENHDLVPLARVAAYKGLVFGSLSADVPALEDWLGELKFFVDLAMDQGPDGMEFVPGRAVYTYGANWKLQMDNGIDAYHLTSTHASFMDVMAKRRSGTDGHQDARQFDAARSHVFDVRLRAGVSVLERALLLRLAPEHFVIAIGVEWRVDVLQVERRVGERAENLQIVAEVNIQHWSGLQRYCQFGGRSHASPSSLSARDEPVVLSRY